MTQDIHRLLEIKLPRRQSAFLWGPRKTGKTTFLKRHFRKSLIFDFLKTDLFMEFSKKPSLLREQLAAKDKAALSHPIILDEVQKVPQILDEVHGLIEGKGLQFILCGSSARKLKRGHANMLGGRAWRYEMFPLVSPEVGKLNLSRCLNQGLIPAHFTEEKYYQKSLKAYIQDYLKEEVFAEGLCRNIPAFSRFFDAMGYSHGELTNYTNIARDCGVDAKTVREYYQILVDTLLGAFVEPYKQRQHRQVISKAAKFYLFDVGVAGAVRKRHIPELRGEAFGRALEHFIFMELRAFRSYRDRDFDIQFWRTKSGQEVDFILGAGEVAVEVKGTSRLDSSDVRSLRIFTEEQKPKKSYLICNERSRRVVHSKIHVVPWEDFLHDLWQGKVI